MPPFQSSTLRRASDVPAGDLPPRIIGGEPRMRPLRVGLISNPQSGQNARRGLLVRIRELLQAHPQVAHFHEDTIAGLTDAVRELTRRETEVVVVNGGDGTVQAVLTALLNTPADALPILAVLPGGTTNTTARNVGYARRPLPALQSILTASARGRLAGSIERRAVLCVDSDTDRQYSMMFGAGGIYHGIRLARGPIESAGLHGHLGASLALATFVGKILSGNGGTLFPPLHADIFIDGKPLPPEPYLGILASTMDRQLLGLYTHWGDGPGPVRFTSMRCAPQRLPSAVVSIVRGVPRPFMRPELGYRSVNADEVHLVFDGGYTLDGELFPPTDGGTRVTLSGRQCAYFLRDRS